MSAHTPGPWRSEYPVVYAASGARLLTVDEYDCATIYDTPLMAAAPELLAALQALLPEYHSAARVGPAEALAQARAAIAKATGVTP